MPRIGSYSLSHLHTLPPLLNTQPPVPIVLTDPNFAKPLMARIIVKSLDKSTIYYTYNSFEPTTINPIIYCSVDLSLSHHGNFELQFEDSEKTLDVTNIRNGARVEIELGKANNTRRKVLSGMIRSCGYSRGCEQNLLYNVSGHGTGIRLNERILDVVSDAPLESDGATIDTSNPDFFAKNIVADSINDADYYPERTLNSKVEGLGGYGYLDSSDTQATSNINDFIPGTILRFGEIEDLHAQIENYTGARIYVGVDDKVHIQPLKGPLSSNTGFIITANPTDAVDLADNTMYISSDDYSFDDDISKDAGYSNSLFGILPADPAIDKTTNSDLGTWFANRDFEVAQRFQPITNPHWRLWATVQAVNMANVDDENTVRARWRICEDDNGVPRNSAGILSNKYMNHNDKYSTTDGGFQTIDIMGDGNLDLNENTWYWLIFSSTNATPTKYWRWAKDDEQSALMATAAPGTSSDTDGGSGWTVSDTTRMSLLQTRYKAEPHNILDHQAISKNIIIESPIPSFPQQIRTKRAAVKYMVGLIQSTARPRRVFDFSSLTVPNRPPLPGDIACIKDTRFNFSTSGNPVIGGQMTDIGYRMGIKGGGRSPNSIGIYDMSASVVAFPQDYI